MLLEAIVIGMGSFFAYSLGTKVKLALLKTLEEQTAKMDTDGTADMESVKEDFGELIITCLEGGMYAALGLSGMVTVIMTAFISPIAAVGIALVHAAMALGIYISD